MKKIVKILLVITIAALALCFAGCNEQVSGLLGNYEFSNIVLTQTGVNEFKIEFSVSCGDDEIQVFLTEGYRLTESSKPKQVTAVKDGLLTRITLTETLDLAESYYVWVVGGGRQEKFSITPPSMFPVLIDQGNGEALFHFKYTYGTAWSDFCDEKGKAIYQSASPVFDSSAKLIVDDIDITQEEYLIPADVFDPNMYYFGVSTAKDGAITNISRPVTFPQNVINQVNGISASITGDLYFCVEVEIKPGSEIDQAKAEHLQLLIKTDTADDVIVANCFYSNGVATMMVSYDELDWKGVWYDVCLMWRGAVVGDVPQYFSGKQVNHSSTHKVDGVIYGIAGWKAEDAPEHSEVLKVYLEDDTTRYVDEFCKSYNVTFSVENVPTLNVTIVLKDDVKTAPVLAITSGNTTKIAEVKGTLNDDGSYTYSLPVKTALGNAGTWYDIRFFFGNTVCEFLKDSCIAYNDYAASYVDPNNGRTYSFKEYNGFLKIMFE